MGQQAVQAQVWLDRAVDIATANVARDGGPFGALVVRDGMLLGEGANRVTADLDPTAHAEVVAIRAACQRVGDFHLRGATLYASCEPCPLCLSAALWARVDAVVFAADRAAAARAGFDDDSFHRLFSTATGAAVTATAGTTPTAAAESAAAGTTATAEGWPMRLEHHPVPRSEDPFDAWRAQQGRVAY